MVQLHLFHFNIQYRLDLRVKRPSEKPKHFCNNSVKFNFTFYRLSHFTLFCPKCLVGDVSSQQGAFRQACSSALPLRTLDLVAHSVGLQVYTCLVYPRNTTTEQKQLCF